MPGLASAAKRLGRSFGYALAGLGALALTQPNFRIHLLAGALAAAAGIVFALPPVEFGLLLLTIAFVLAAEAMNTALEALADAAAPSYHPLVKSAKDIAAGGVLLAALGAIGVAASLFVPRLANLLR